MPCVSAVGFLSLEVDKRQNHKFEFLRYQRESHVCVPTFRPRKGCQQHCCRSSNISNESSSPHACHCGLAMRQDAKTTVIDHVAEFHAERARLVGQG